ncbi:Lnb N-terminal periplasmic domain-containing protein [Stutzerimonas nitrititolerans]|uniref:Lnb N-terminal periplasmic domain-containing protein n=1 Tax=Stutzerimonas nitrititolerans TaxID=2482751 RepID=UPI00289F3998|nr:DUF4105 domain-containing protein [Stutzerimonas nitrititolerans]
MIGRIFLRLLVTLMVVLATAWGSLALWYQLPMTTASKYAFIALWCMLALGLLFALWRRRPWLALGGFLLLFALLLVWWNTLAPSNQRVWVDDLAKLTTGRVEGSQVTLNNVRNFDWRSDEDYVPRWETRRYVLDRLTSVDLATSYWGMPAIAHVLVSFGFDDGQFVVFTVEIRKERGERYSEIGGFFKQFELSIVAADERDALRVRTNVRDEDVYLYRVNMSEEAMRALFLSYIEQTNQLEEGPRFYNTITANCTTIVFDMMRQIVQGLPMDYRLLLTGYLPDYVRDVGGLQANLGLEELQRRGRITERAQQAGDDPEFSRLIRDGVPGW